MNIAEAEDVDWMEFLENPVGYVDAERLAFCFGGAVSRDLCGSLKENDRLRDRLADTIRDHYWLPPMVAGSNCSEDDRIIAMSPADKLQEIVLRAGCIYWSAAIANTVLASDVAVLQDEIGDELCAFAIKHRDLAGPEKTLSPIDTIKHRIAENGWHSLVAWCETLDPAIGARVRLKLPPNDILDSTVECDFHEIGPAIVRRAAAEAI